MNTLYLGDCLEVLRGNIPDNSIDLIYIDPPFNSKRDYNIFFDDKEIQTQRIAFEDTWSLKNIQDSLAELHTLTTDNVYFLLLTYQKVAPHAFPYLTMMALRILELHRVLKDTGSFYLHCDPTMSHYLKTMCDVIFEPQNFRNDIIWKRTNTHNDAKNKFADVTDRILYYTKSDKYFYNPLFSEHSEEYIKNFYRFDDNDGKGLYQLADMASPNPRPNMMYEWKGFPCPVKGWRYQKDTMQKLHDDGRIYYPANKDGSFDLTKRPRLKRYLNEQNGNIISNSWDDIPPLGAHEKERLGYPTQKPKALLERIIQASSNEGDTVLDAFCGCGTTIDAAESLHRKWIGIDISPMAVSLIKRRLKDTYKDSLNKFEVRGVPVDEASAEKLWKENPFAFQDWWLTEFEVFSTTYGTKGADKGIDGIGQYLVDKDTTIRAAFQVKGGAHIKSAEMDSLLGVLEKHKCQLGVFLTITEPTKPMLDTAAGAGFVEYNGIKYPKIQILTLKDYFNNKRPKLPSTNITFKSAQLKGKQTKQIKLDL